MPCYKSKLGTLCHRGTCNAGRWDWVHVDTLSVNELPRRKNRNRMRRNAVYVQYVDLAHEISSNKYQQKQQ